MTLLDQTILDAIGRSESLGPVTVQRADIRKYSIATGQTEPRFLKGDEAPPMFFMSIAWVLGELSDLAEDGLGHDLLIPDFPLEQRMGGGMRIESIRPIVPGDTLSATRTLLEIYEKQGRAGPLIFHVSLTEISDAHGNVVIRSHDKRIVK